MRRYFINLVVALFTFVIGLFLTFGFNWIQKSFDDTSFTEFLSRDLEEHYCDYGIRRDLSLVIDAWERNEIKGKKIALDGEFDNIEGELIQLNSDKEKELIITSCPRFNVSGNERCSIFVYEKDGTYSNRLLEDKLDWHYAIKNGRISHSYFGQWGKDEYKDLHVLINGTENVYTYDGFKYELKNQIKYKM